MRSLRCSVERNGHGGTVAVAVAYSVTDNTLLLPALSALERPFLTCPLAAFSLSGSITERGREGGIREGRRERDGEKEGDLLTFHL
jgi:hypothetical protein